MIGSRTWVVPTLSQCYGYLRQDTLAEANATQIPFDANQNPLIPDRFTAVMLEVTDSIRTRIQSLSGFVVSLTPNSVPPELIGLACGRIITRLEYSFPMHSEANKALLAAWKVEWESFLNMDELSYYGVSLPDDPMTGDVQSNNPPVQVLRATCRRVTVCSMRGI